MAKSWSEVANSPEYKALPPKEQDAARSEYFDDVYASKVPEEDREAAKKEFLSDTAPKQAESRGFLAETGRQAALAGRAVLEAPAQIAAMPGDAIANVYNLAKQKEPITASQFNPLSSKGWASPSGPGMMKPASESIHEGLTAAGLPEPESTTEKIAFGVESALAGAKTPLGVRASTNAAAQAARSGAPQSSLDAVRSGLSAPTPEARGIQRAERKSTKNALSALDKVEKALKRDKNTLQGASEEVKAAQGKGVPLTLADSGPNATTTAEISAQRPGEAQAIMHKDRLQSLKDTKSRVGGAVRESLQAKEDAGLFQQELKHIRSDKAQVNYEAVRQDTTPITDPEINKILEHPVIQKLYETARNNHMTERSLASTTGKQVPPLVDIYGVKNVKSPILDKTGTPFQNMEAHKTGTVPDVRSLDYLVRAIDKEITRMYTEARKGGTEGGVASELKTAMKQISNRLEKISPAYKKASDEYGLDSNMMDAREHGQKKFLTETPGMAAQYVKNLSPAGKKALRVGVAEKLLANLERTSRNVDIAGNVLGGDRQQAVLRTLFDNDKDFEMFKKVMETESKIHGNSGQITKGSQTFRRIAAAEDFEEESASEKFGKYARVASLVKHGWIGSGVSAFIHMVGHPTWNQGKAEMVARILTSKDPEAIVARLRAMDKPQSTLKNIAKRSAVPAAKGAATLRGNSQQPEVSTRTMSGETATSPWVSAEGKQYPSTLQDNSPQ